MDTEEYNQAIDLERNGNTQEGFALIKKLAETGNPLALLDLSARYYSIDGYAYPVEPVKQDLDKSESLAIQAKDILRELSNNGDGEAMRMLAQTFLGHWHPVYEKSIEEAESLFLMSYDSGCHFAANELATFYLGSDIEKAKYYYKKAEEHNCRVVYDDRLEPALNED